MNAQACLYKESKILVVDGDPDSAKPLSQYLSAQGWMVSQAESGQEALVRVQEQAFDLIFLNLQLPDTDGHALCREIRARSSAGVIVTSGCDDRVERIVSYESGADVFFPKPLQLRELHACGKNLLARIRHRQPQAAPAGTALFASQDWHFSAESQMIACGTGTQASLTRNETLVLQALISNAGRVMPREELLKALGNREWNYSDRTIDVLIARLRGKFKQLAIDTGCLVTHYGIGYMFMEIAPAI
ncbi:response regulator transcription factor [Marinobacterium aestuariivivens]|uniref:Response regulator transcription factor n=1 Tax=Marinobacterium aestuariivivens TaxID=1698799 RepID=A0ABW1ZZL8_9GAMM